MADTEQTLADLIEPLCVSTQLGSDTEADTTAGPWMKFRAPSAPVLSDEEVPGVDRGASAYPLFAVDLTRRSEFTHCATC